MEYTYIYKGPVTSFGKTVANNWSGKTIAPSENKARNNLIYQYKKQNNLTPDSKISLPGKLKTI